LFVFILFQVNLLQADQIMAKHRIVRASLVEAWSVRRLTTSQSTSEGAPVTGSLCPPVRSFRRRLSWCATMRPREPRGFQWLPRFSRNP